MRYVIIFVCTIKNLDIAGVLIKNKGVVNSVFCTNGSPALSPVVITGISSNSTHTFIISTSGLLVNVQLFKSLRVALELIL